MPSRRTNNFPESGRGLGHVTPTIFGVRSAILATAWLLVYYCVKRSQKTRSNAPITIDCPQSTITAYCIMLHPVAPERIPQFVTFSPPTPYVVQTGYVLVPYVLTV